MFCEVELVTGLRLGFGGLWVRNLGVGLGRPCISVLRFPSVFWPTLPGGQLCHQTDVRAV